jgi:hypothetical protein
LLTLHLHSTMHFAFNLIVTANLNCFYNFQIFGRFEHIDGVKLLAILHYCATECEWVKAFWHISSCVALFHSTTQVTDPAMSLIFTKW